MDSRKDEYGWTHTKPLSDHIYTLPAILSLIPKSGDSKHLSILDAGSGNGYIARELYRRGYQVTAFDISPDGIGLAKEIEPNIKWFVRSLYDNLQDLSESGFDVIVSSEVIEHLYSPQKFLSNMHSILRENGTLILTTPYHGYLKNLALSLFDAWDKHHTVEWEGGHIKFFSQKSISKMLQQTGFDQIQFNNAGRTVYLYKSMVLSARKSKGLL